MYLTNDLMNWADQLNDICILRVMDIHWSYQHLLFWAVIVWHRLSANQIVRCFKLKKLKNYMRYQVYFYFHWSYKKYRTILGCARKYSWPINLQDFWLLTCLIVIIPGVHCYIVLVSTTIACSYFLLFILLTLISAQQI